MLAERAKARLAVAAAIAARDCRQRVLAQREFEAGLAAIEARLLQRLLQGALIALHEVERFGALDEHPRVDGTVLVDIKAHIDTAEFGGIEADLEARIAGLNLPGDLESHLRQVDLLDGCLVGGVNGSCAGNDIGHCDLRVQRSEGASGAAAVALVAAVAALSALSVLAASSAAPDLLATSVLWVCCPACRIWLRPRRASGPLTPEWCLWLTRLESERPWLQRSLAAGEVVVGLVRSTLGQRVGALRGPAR